MLIRPVWSEGAPELRHRIICIRSRRKVRRSKCKKPSSRRDEGLAINSLTMSYFHTGIRTIIGAEAFHCPVRDGKEWDHLAMVIRLNRSLP